MHRKPETRPIPDGIYHSDVTYYKVANIDKLELAKSQSRNFVFPLEPLLRRKTNTSCLFKNFFQLIKGTCT